MAEIISEFVTYLKTKSGITSLVGSSTGARIFPERPKQAATLPYLVVSQSSGQEHTNLSGRSGIANATIEVISVGSTRAAADALSTAVDAELSPANKTMGSTFVTEVVQQLHRDAGDDLPQDASDTPRYWCRSTYQLWYITS